MDQATQHKIVSFDWGISGRVTAFEAKSAQRVECPLYGQEIIPKISAVCEASILLKGVGENADRRRTLGQVLTTLGAS